jgi:C-terminal processing protease CtpA/Prc
MHSAIILLALLLTGSVQTSDSPGRIGIRWHPGKGHKIEKVCPHSPAEIAGLQVNDRILNCTTGDGVSHTHVNGPAYSEIDLTIQRGEQVLHFTIVRIPAGDIED